MCKPVAASVQAPSTQDAELKPELLAQPLVNASREEQLKDLCQAVADLNPDRPWEDLLGRHKEFEELFTWVLRNPGEQRLHERGPCSSRAWVQGSSCLLPKT